MIKLGTFVCELGIVRKYQKTMSEILRYEVPADCSEEQGWDGSMELTCQNEYVTLATNSGGGVFINNSEEYNSCVIEPAMGIYSCQQSPKPTYNTIYTTSTGGLRTGSTIDPSNYENGYDEEDVPSTYLRYHATNNVVDEVDVCKKPTANAGEICVTVEQPSRYSEIKETILEYFGGSSQNMPAECSEETGWSGDLELTCANSYVVIGFDSGGGTWVKDVENQTECLIQPAFGIYSCS